MVMNTSAPMTSMLKTATRPPKPAPELICRRLGFVSVNDFLSNLRTIELSHFEDFVSQAFVEYPKDASLTACKRGNRDGLSFGDMPGYVAAYTATYGHHYKMQDDWQAIITDSDLFQYTGMAPTELQEHSPWIVEAQMPFELFERAMLCIADDDFFTNCLRGRGGVSLQTEGGGLYLQWIIEWRLRLDRYLPDVDGTLRAAVWRDNWRDVRDALVVLNERDYPVRLRDLPLGERLSVDESAGEGILVLSDRLMGERRITPKVHMIKEATTLKTKGRKYHLDAVTMMAWSVGKDVFRLADGPWRAYIEAKSGNSFQLHFP